MIQQQLKWEAFLFLLFLLVVCSSCSNQHSFVVSDVQFLTNYSSYKDQDTLAIQVDLQDAVLNGIEIPTVRQTKNGFFNFKFTIKNTSSFPQRFYYKIYYQNESYKFEETQRFADENFYGSWLDANVTFLPTTELLPGAEELVVDSFKIVGNPRNELSCLGNDPAKFILNTPFIEKKKNDIRRIPEWMEQVKEKAKAKKIPLDEELYQNALWLINDEMQREKTYNNRWKRNPRMGNYRIVLVITAGKDLAKIPFAVQSINSKNDSGKFVNPFSFFIPKNTIQLTETQIVNAPVLQVKTRFDFSKGIYEDVFKMGKSDYSKTAYCSTCGDADSLYKYAQFTQYFHYVNKDFLLRNIPIKADVVAQNISRNDYASWLKQYDKSNKLIKNYVCTTDFPCKTIKVDQQNKKLVLINPASPEGEFRKEHVGVNTRIGFTYGKFIAKLKFPKQLSKDNVWNGLTNAFWLLFQGDGEWNKRRICEADIGYIEKHLPDVESSLSKSKKSICYSEIDFELIKETPYWPKTSYKNSNTTFKTEDGTANQNIMVCCTNWDMACHMPKKFDIGARNVTVDGNTYLFHRWDHFYKALTAKIPVEHDEIYANDYYYFEIEWLPQRIVWKIGSEKNKLKTICVMTDEFTSIPNNQMVMVFTQEWHNQEWWPTAPFKQNFIPYPAKDIVGEILDVEVE
ncbi:MAG TPA: hypothetical protein PLI68_09610 [Bacteroidia bacterium]|nr:hypothetical protein [Bacteroidia bacterium]